MAQILPKFSTILTVQEPEDGIELFCKVHGRPRPLIKWFLNGQILKPTLNTTRVQILEDHQVVRINYVSAKDEGLYECKAENTVGYTKATHLVQLKSTAELDAMYAQISLPVIIAVVIALLVVILLLVIAKICYMKRQKKPLWVVASSFLNTYCYHSIKRTGYINQPGLTLKKKS